MRRVTVLLVALSVALACGQTQSSPDHPLVLGAIYPLSGPQAEGGRQELAGVQAALRVSHANVRLQVIDATTPQQASAAVDRLVHDFHVPGVPGTYGHTPFPPAGRRAAGV